MDNFSVERLVYDGSDPSDDWVVTSIGHSKLNLSNVKTVPIQTMHEFEAGCSLHENCLGHMGKSSSGLLLPIQSLSVHNINISNSIYKATETALKGTSEFHKAKYYEILRESMRRKTGRMRRGILNCHIDGSLRMVITPQWDFPRNVVAIPSYLQGKWKVCRFNKETNKYATLPVLDGDRAVVVRPPSLSAKSIQPMVIRFWPETCMGISPDILKSFEGDYDGDEMHVNPVYSDKALEECEAWVNTPNHTVEKAMAKYEASPIPEKDDRAGGYMIHTTMSFKQMLLDQPQPIMAEETRTKKDHILAIKERMLDPQSVHEVFDKESIRGMADINRRYLTQPIIGDMSRIAKIVASCVSQRDDGYIGIYNSKGFHPVRKEPMDPAAGNSTVRAISVICASAQQVALDAHRVAKDSLPSHDMINDLIVGSEHTMIVLSKVTDIRQYLTDPAVKWKHTVGSLQYLICRPDWQHIGSPSDIVAAYNPQVLARISPAQRFDVCYNGIRLILNYYSISLSHSEISSLAVLYTYLPGLSKLPITTRNGAHSRNLQWLETTMIRHYTGLMATVNSKAIDPYPLKTVSACLVGANFVS
jgi:hypothetical protein